MSSAKTAAILSMGRWVNVWPQYEAVSQHYPVKNFCGCAHVASQRCIQLIVAKLRHMSSQIWVNIGSGDGLLPDSTKPLPEANVDCSSMRSRGIHLTIISYEMLNTFITDMNLEIINCRLLPNIPWASELTLQAMQCLLA